jgi:hypothetical protein
LNGLCQFHITIQFRGLLFGALKKPYTTKPATLFVTTLLDKIRINRKKPIGTRQGFWLYAILG